MKDELTREETYKAYKDEWAKADKVFKDELARKEADKVSEAIKEEMNKRYKIPGIEIITGVARIALLGTTIGLLIKNRTKK